jgi:uncharacterized protein YecE (DUF72 family)
MKKGIYVGTSGYAYPHWRGVFYPSDLASYKWLEFYAQHFNSVELNVTFYRLPQKKAFEGWYKRTPRNFKFVIKGSRFITHIKKLQTCADALKIFFDNAASLRSKLLCVLWQLPPSLKCNIERLEDFLKLLKKKYSFCLHSFEFRNGSWFNEEMYGLLKIYDSNLCIADSPNFPCSEAITVPFLYLRFHGGKTLYSSEYSEEELHAWLDKVKMWSAKENIKTILAFFNNDAQGFAVKNALQFKEILARG